MRVYQTFYKDKNGKRKAAKKFYLDFSDHRGIRHRWPALESENQSREFARQLKRLIRYRAADEIPDMQLLRWIENLPRHFLNLLVSVDLLSPQKAAAGKLLSEHIDDFKQSLLSKGETDKNAKQVTSRVKKIIEGCKFRTFSEISANKIERYLAELRNKGLGISTSNYYLKSLKHFCSWMVENRRAVESPVEYIKTLNNSTDIRHNRRALEPDEIRRLLETTQTAGKRFKMNGYQRALLYRLAIETGLRASELRSLKVSSFDLNGCTVTIEAAYSKHRRQDILPLRADTAKKLESFLSDKMPGVRVFNMPDKTADMIKQDLNEAGIDYIDEAGRYADFHSLRHTTGSLLAASGTHPKVAQSIMRHSDINLTMSRYSHIFRGQDSEAVEKLPDLSLPSSQAERIKKTGTDDVTEDKNFAIYCAISGHTTGDNTLHQIKTNRVLDNKNAVYNEAEGARTLSLRIDSPTL
jgi:integrase